MSNTIRITLKDPNIEDAIRRAVPGEENEVARNQLLDEFFKHREYATIEINLNNLKARVVPVLEL